MIATEEEMDSARLTPPERDYCADKLMLLRSCHKREMPLLWHCKKEKHAFHDCVFEDHLLRMKEWERERRLRQRALRKAKKAALEKKEEL